MIAQSLRREQVELVAPSPQGAAPDSSNYRLENVGTTRQRVVFVAMQLVMLATLLCLSVQIITIFLSPLVGSTAIFAILALYCVAAVFWQIVYVYRMLQMKRAVLLDTQGPAGLRIAMATTIVPSREFALLRGKLEGMVRVDHCGNSIDCWVLDEEDDPRVRAMIHEFNRRYRRRGARIRHFTRKNKPQYNERPVGRRFRRFQQRQKGGNLNAWLASIAPETYDVITFLDLDHVPKPEFYRNVLPYFRDPDVAFVQGPESFRNRQQNFITRAASFERDTFFGLVHRSYFGLGMPIIVGSHTTFRAETIRSLGNCYPVHLTEDYLLMLQLRSMKKRGIFVDQVLAVGELPSTWTAYLGQQYRWASGGLDLLVRYFPKLWRTYTLKEKLFYFALLNYYAWGTLYVCTKGVLHALLLVGLALHLETGLIVGIVVFTVAAAAANFLWERQFFIERAQRSFFFENAVMNNFLGCHYFVALLKALASPNTPFCVTAKSGTTAARRGKFSGFLWLSGVFASADAMGLAGAWALSRSGSGVHVAGLSSNVLLYPLLLAVSGNAFVLLFSHWLERPEMSRGGSRLRVFSSNRASKEHKRKDLGQEQIAANPRRRFAHA